MIKDSALNKDLFKEIAMLQNLNHPNVIKYICKTYLMTSYRYLGLYKVEECYAMVLEFVSGGNLLQLLKDVGEKLKISQLEKM